MIASCGAVDMSAVVYAARSISLLVETGIWSMQSGTMETLGVASFRDAGFLQPVFFSSIHCEGFFGFP